MTQNEREHVVRSFVNQSADRAEKSKSAIQAMQEALNLSEVDRRKLSESCRESKIRLQKALADQERLEEENRRLANRVTQLTEELQQSREQSDQLLNHVREENQKEWLKRETMFKNTIRKLQKQLRAERAQEVKNPGTTVVPKVDRECRALQPVPAKVRVGNTVIRPVSHSTPSNRLPLLAAQLNGSVPSQKVTVLSPPQTSEGLKSDENRGRVSPPPPSAAIRGILKPKRVFGSNSLRLNGQVADKKVKAAVRSKPQKETGIQLPQGILISKECSARPIDAFKGSKTPSKNRAEFVRGNGGLRGLQEKLRQVRSPRFLS